MSHWETVEAFYKLATVIMLAVCFLAFAVNRQTIDLFAAAAVIFAFTLMSMVMVDSYPPPWRSAHMVPQDVACAWIAWWAAGRSNARWPHWLKIIFSVQCGIHALYWGGLFISGRFLEGRFDSLLERTYPWPINTLFVISIIVMWAAGGGHVARYVRDSLRRFLHLPGAVGAGGA